MPVKEADGQGRRWTEDSQPLEGVRCQAPLLDSSGDLTSQQPGMGDTGNHGGSLLVSDPGFRPRTLVLLSVISITATCLSKHCPCPVGTERPIAGDTNNPQRKKTMVQG